MGWFRVVWPRESCECVLCDRVLGDGMRAFECPNGMVYCDEGCWKNDVLVERPVEVPLTGKVVTSVSVSRWREMCAVEGV
jgi:hypothetical protein